MRLAFVLPLLLLWAAWPALASEAVHGVAGDVVADANRVCDAAAARSELEMDIPPGVLAAVGTVESGRGAGALGAPPWPWTINAAGRGTYFATKQDAIAGVLALMARGYPYIDVGCFQIDILYHAGVFRSLDEAFDPRRNAQEAARILGAERRRGLDWATSVAHYHSANPEHGLPYLQRVRAALPQARARANSAEMMRAFAASSVAAKLGAGAALPRVIYALPIQDAALLPQARGRTSVGRPSRID